MGAIDIPNTVSDGVYDIEITMTDLAGNVSLAATANDIIRVKNSGPVISGKTPANNTTALPTDPVNSNYDRCKCRS